MDHHRRAMRLRGFRYGAGYSYFVTICTTNRLRVLSSIANDEVTPTRLGELAKERWAAIPHHHQKVMIDLSVLMPDHMHGILHIREESMATLPLIMAMFKGAVTRRARSAGIWGPGPLWQRGYHERVIRGPRHLDRVREYLRANPFRWRE